MKNKKIVNSFNKVKSNQKEHIFDNIINQKNKKHDTFKYLTAFCSIAIIFTMVFYDKPNDKASPMMLTTKSIAEFEYKNKCYQMKSYSYDTASTETTDASTIGKLIDKTYIDFFNSEVSVYKSPNKNEIVIKINDEYQTYQICEKK